MCKLAYVWNLTSPKTTDYPRQSRVVNKLCHQITECIHVLIAVDDEYDVVKDRPIGFLGRRASGDHFYGFFMHLQFFTQCSEGDHVIIREALP